MPRNSDLSTNIPNSDNTPFWTITEIGGEMLLRGINGDVITGYEMAYSSRANGGSFLKSEYVSATEETVLTISADKSIVSGGMPTILTVIGVSAYYSKNTAQTTSIGIYEMCDTDEGVKSSSVSGDVICVIGDETCKNDYEIYSFLDYFKIGYRTVITVKEK